MPISALSKRSNHFRNVGNYMVSYAKELKSQFIQIWKQIFRNSFTCTASFSSTWALFDAHIMSESFSPNKLLFVAPEKNPRLSLRKGWPYSHGSVSSTLTADCNTPVMFMAHIIRVCSPHVRMDLFLQAAYRKWVTYHSCFNDEFEYYLKIYLFSPILNESKIKS